MHYAVTPSTTGHSPPSRQLPSPFRDVCAFRRSIPLTFVSFVVLLPSPISNFPSSIPIAVPLSLAPKVRTMPTWATPQEMVHGNSPGTEGPTPSARAGGKGIGRAYSPSVPLFMAETQAVGPPQRPPFAPICIHSQFQSPFSRPLPSAMGPHGVGNR